MWLSGVCFHTTTTPTGGSILTPFQGSEGTFSVQFLALLILAIASALSRSTRAVINQNFLFGVLFIIVGLTVTSLGYLGPIPAAILHNVGSLIVIFNSARLVRKGEELEHFHPEPVEPKPGSGSRPDSGP